MATGLLCDISFYNYPGAPIISNIAGTIEIPIPVVTAEMLSDNEFDITSLGQLLSSKISGTQTVAFATKPGVSVDNPTDFIFLQCRENSEYPSDIGGWGAVQYKDGIYRVSQVSNAQIAYPFTIVTTSPSNNISVLAERPEWSPTTFDRISLTNFGGYNDVDKVHELHPFVGYGPPQRSKLFITSPEGDSATGPAGGVEGNPIDQGTIFKASLGQSITFKFAMLYADGSVDETVETAIIPPVLPESAGIEPHWFDVVNDNTVVVDPLGKEGRLLGSYAVLKSDWHPAGTDATGPLDYDVANFVLQVGNYQPPYISNPGSSGTTSGPTIPNGTFPTDPGPSMLEDIPNGSAGNDVAQSGLYTKYLLNKQYMDLLGDILWEDNIVINALKEIFGNPVDSIISCMSYPFNLVNFVNRTDQNLFFGHIDTNLPFIALTKSSFQIDWGKIEIPFAWGNFLDYSPYTKVELFLPWGPGYVTIDPNDIMPYSNIPGNINTMAYSPGSIQIKTNIELDKGTCVHNVVGNNGRVIGAFSGMVGRSIPLTAIDTAGKALATIGAVAAVATAGASTAATAASGSFNKIVHGSPTPINGGQGMVSRAHEVFDPSKAAGALSSNVSNSSAPNMASRALFNTPFAYPRAGTFSDGSAAMTIQQPFLIISRPLQSVPAQYGHYNGYPSNIYYDNFSGISGYTEISEIHLDNISATTDELDELDSILKGGILL